MTPAKLRAKLLDALINGLPGVMLYMPRWITRRADVDPDYYIADRKLWEQLNQADCGTAACIGGHLDLISNKSVTFEQAGRALAVPYDEWKRLCWGHPGAAWPHCRNLDNVTKNEAIEATKRLFAAYPLEETA